MKKEQDSQKVTINTVKRTIQEEIIASLAAICSILCFGFGFKVAGWMFAIKALKDAAISLAFAYKDILDEKENSEIKVTEGCDGY